MRLPWAEASSRFTALFEALAISWLKEASQQGIAELLALSWDEIHGILERAVQRGLERRAAEPIPYLGVDEKSFRKRHRYLTVVNDLKPLARVVRRRGTPPGQPGRLLEDVERRATRPSRGRRDGHVGSLRRLDPGASRRIGEKDRLRQISHRGASGEGGGPGAAGGEQAFTGPRRRAFDRHEVRLAAASGELFRGTPGASSARCAKAT